MRLEPGSDPDAQARDAAARGARITFVYRDVFPGYAAVLPPGGLRGIEGGPGGGRRRPGRARPAVGRARDRHPHGAPKLPWGLDRIDQRALPLSGTYTPPARPRRARASPPTSSTPASRRTTATSAAGSGRASPRSTTGAAPTTAPGTARTSPARSAARRAGWRPASRWSRCAPWTATAAGETSGVIAGIDWAARDHRARHARRGEPEPGRRGQRAASTPRSAGWSPTGSPSTVAAGNEDADACGSSPGAGAGRADRRRDRPRRHPRLVLEPREVRRPVRPRRRHRLRLAHRRDRDQGAVRHVDGEPARRRGRGAAAGRRAHARRPRRSRRGCWTPPPPAWSAARRGDPDRLLYVGSADGHRRPGAPRRRPSVSVTTPAAGVRGGRPLDSVGRCRRRLSRAQRPASAAPARRPPPRPTDQPSTAAQASGSSGRQPKNRLTPGVWTTATSTANEPAAVASTSGLRRPAHAVCAELGADQRGQAHRCRPGCASR